MSSKTLEESNTIFSSIHYIITLIFFLVILVDIVKLTISTINMSVDSDNENAVIAKNFMIAASAITYIGELIIILFLLIAYSYQSYETPDIKNYYETLKGITGAENLYVALRIVAFSILMFISIVVSALCYEALHYIDISDDPSEYTDQYNVCKEITRLFFLHFVLFSSIQGVAYIYQLFYNSGVVETSAKKLIVGNN